MGECLGDSQACKGSLGVISAFPQNYSTPRNKALEFSSVCSSVSYLTSFALYFQEITFSILDLWDPLSVWVIANHLCG